MGKFMLFWSIVSVTACHTHPLAPLHESRFIAGVWDNHLTVAYDDGNDMKVRTTALNSDRNEWEMMTHLPSTHTANRIIDSIQLRNHSLIFMMHPSFTDVYDLSVHKFVAKYHYNHPIRNPHLAATQRKLCITESVKDNLLFIIASNGLLSFDLLTKMWSAPTHNHTVLKYRVTAGCAMDLTDSFIYIFGGISEVGSEYRYDETIVKYTVTDDEWGSVPNAVIHQQSDRIKCGLSPSDGYIYCVTGDILYYFNPLRERMTNLRIDMATYTQYYSMVVGWHDLCIIMVGGNDTDVIQYTIFRTLGKEHSSAETLVPPTSMSGQPITDIFTGHIHRRQLASWPMITLNSSYTENLTLEAGNIYVVNSDVQFSSVTKPSLIIPNNVTILFNETSAQITVTGHLFMGTCFDDGTIGVSSNPVRVYTTGTTGNIISITGAGYDVSICDTNFSRIFRIEISGRSNILFDNLEFYNVDGAIRVSGTTGPETITDSYFYKGSASLGVLTGCYGAGVVRNNIFEHVTWAIYGGDPTNGYTIINNTFIGGGGGYAIRDFLKPVTICNNSFIGFDKSIYQNKLNIVSHNVFRDNNYGIYMPVAFDNTGGVTRNDFIGNNYGIFMGHRSGVVDVSDVKYNNFISNGVAIWFGRAAFRNVTYNNFINNTIIFDVSRYPDQLFCGRNYYGITTTNPWDIQTYMYDVCNGNAYNLYPNYVKWWPWYNERIDFDALPVASTAYGDDDSHLADCRGPNLHPDINGTQLSPIWLGDLRLTADKSPYYVICNTRVGYDFIIEPSVQLIFVSSYIFYTTRNGGAVLIGKSMCNDTMQYNGIGLYDNNTAIHINGPARFNMDDGSERAYICNTKFRGGSAVLNLYTIPGALVDNCEFHQITGYGVFIKWMEFNATVRDTLFYDVYYAIETLSDRTYSNPGTILIEHNTFQLCARRAIYANDARIFIINNTFENDGTAIAVEGRTFEENIINDNIFINFQTVFYNVRGSNYTRNLFINNDIVFDIGDHTGTHAIYHNEMINNSIVIQAMHQSTGYLDVQYNNFVGNNVSIVFLNGSPRFVQYNNFIDNALNYVMQSAVNADCARNWNGDSNDIADPALIQDNKIRDSCTPNGYNGKIIFWPYFDGPLFFDDLTNLPALYNFSYSDCTSLTLDAEFVPGQPTRSPSSDAPTTDPTAQPSVPPSAAPTAPPTSAPSASPTYPTYGPTLYPTADPTVDPTVDPTSDPTDEPTVEPTSDPTRDPTVEPTNDPTFDPTRDPTKDPTIDPTHDPTNDPTVDPTTDPTRDPTTDPTIDPTIDPTFDPTIDPTRDPTTDPTRDPTNDPTLDPTTDPTTEPTHDPTVDPTTDPTADPTVKPTTDPTNSPTLAPSVPPTESPSSFAELLDELNLNGEDSSSDFESEMLVTLGLGSVAVFVLILALVTRRSDDQDYEAVALYILQCFDLYSDIILAGLLYNYYLHARSNAVFDTKQTDFLALLCWVCILSAIVPYFLNIFTAISIISKLSRQKNIPSFTKDYFDSHTGVYASGVLLNGGCYTTLALLNSKLFNLSVFNSGLSSYKLRQFEHFKIFNTVVLENSPQIVVQGLALYTFGEQTSIVFGSTIWASFISSVLSVLLSVMIWCLRRTGNNDYFRIRLELSVLDVISQNMKHTINGMDIDVITPPNDDKYESDAYFKCMIENSKYRKQLGIQIAKHFGIAPSNIQILSAYPLRNKLKVNAIFRCNKHQSHLFDPDTLETHAICIEFIELLQNVFEIKGAWLSVQIQVYQMDEKQTQSRTSNIYTERQMDTAITDTGDSEMDAHSLLNKWKLGMYWSVLRQNGFTEVEEWEHLSKDTEKLKGWGFKEGHILQFQRKYREQLHNNAVPHPSQQVELQSKEVPEYALAEGASDGDIDTAGGDKTTKDEVKREEDDETILME